MADGSSSWFPPGRGLNVSRIQEIAFLVFGQLAVGGTFLLSLRSLEGVGLGFFRTNGLIFLIALLSGLALFPRPSSIWHPPVIGYFLIFFSLFGFVLLLYNLRLWFRHPYSSRPLLFAASLLGGVGMLISVTYYLPPVASSFRVLSLSVYFLNSGLLLGAGVLAMMLGHSYLTQPSLSIVPLQYLVKIFMILIFIAGGLALANLLAVSSLPRFREALLLNSFEGVYLWIRLLIGIMGPMVLAPMILKTVQLRSTMAATGLLYIAMLMVLIGELFSRFFLLMDMTIL